MTKDAVHSEKLIKELHLDNGLTVRFYDHTRRYYGDFYLVKLEVLCQVPVRMDYFPVQEAFAEARMLLGEAVLFRRTVERMGVPTGEVDRAIDGLMENFVKHSLAYVASPSFPPRLVMSQLNQARRKRGGVPCTGTPDHA
jgi:hypothetical protein